VTPEVNEIRSSLAIVFLVLLAGMGGACGSGGVGGGGNDGGGQSTDGWLRVEGNRILKSDGTRFHGRGANIFDTRLCGVCAWADPNVSEVIRRIDELVDVWGANFMRLDLTSYASNIVVINGTTYHLAQWDDVRGDSGYLADLHQIVDQVETKPGVYLLLSLWSHPSLPWNELPTDDTQAIWAKLAQEFNGSPRVLYGITNEPHGASDAEVWEAMNRTVATIRSVEPAGGPHHLIAVQGTQDWARDLSHYLTNPITAGGGVNVVYETHAYDHQAQFAERFATPSLTIPVIIGEFGPDGTYMYVSDAEALMPAAEQAEVPYLGWSFQSGCPPDLVQGPETCQAGASLQPTTWGQLLKTRLAGPW
jgi:hypothetical protein